MSRDRELEKLIDETFLPVKSGYLTDDELVYTAGATIQELSTNLLIPYEQLLERLTELELVLVVDGIPHLPRYFVLAEESRIEFEKAHNQFKDFLFGLQASIRQGFTRPQDAEKMAKDEMERHRVQSSKLFRKLIGL